MVIQVFFNLNVVSSFWPTKHSFFYSQIKVINWEWFCHSHLHNFKLLEKKFIPNYTMQLLLIKPILAKLKIWSRLCILMEMISKKGNSLLSPKNLLTPHMKAFKFFVFVLFCFLNVQDLASLKTYLSVIDTTRLVLLHDV